MKFLISVLIAAIFSLIGTFPTAAMDKQVVGWVEQVRLQPGNILLEAKLDTGAEYSSLDATNITEFNRNGEKWVSFELNNHNGKTITLEGKVIRYAPIKRHYGKSQRRPVIRLGLCVGKVYRETEVNLVDRSGFIYPFLVGRKFMEGRLIIDPSAKFTVEPNCGEQTKSE